MKTSSSSQDNGKNDGTSNNSDNNAAAMTTGTTTAENSTATKLLELVCDLKRNHILVIRPILAIVGFTFDGDVGVYRLQSRGFSNLVLESEDDVAIHLATLGIPNLQKLKKTERAILTLFAMFAHVPIEDAVAATDSSSGNSSRKILSNEEVLSLLLRQDVVKILKKCDSSNTAETYYESAITGEKLGSLDEIRCNMRAKGLLGLLHGSVLGNNTGKPSQQADDIVKELGTANCKDLLLWAAMAPFSLHKYMNPFGKLRPLSKTELNKTIEDAASVVAAPSSSGTKRAMLVEEQCGSEDPPQLQQPPTKKHKTSEKSVPVVPAENKDEKAGEGESNHANGDEAAPAAAAGEPTSPTNSTTSTRQGTATSSNDNDIRPDSCVSSPTSVIPSQLLMTRVLTKEQALQMPTEELKQVVEFHYQKRLDMIDTADRLYRWIKEHNPRDLDTLGIGQNQIPLDPQTWNNEMLTDFLRRLRKVKKTRKDHLREANKLLAWQGN